MHSVLALSALMATAALAKPLAHQHMHEKRQVVVNEVVTDVVYVTAVATVIVTAGADSVAVAAETATSTSTSAASVQVVANAWNWHSWTWGRQSTTTAAASTSTTTLAAVSTSTTVIATSEAPTPTPSSTYVAPSTSTTIPVPVTSVAAPTTPSSTPAPPPASTTVTGGLTAYSEIALYHHNIHRTNHSSVPATWNASLVAAAQDWAQSCNYSHNTVVGGGGYGQNIAAGVHADNVSAIITDLFYNGEVGWYAGQYGLTNPDFTNFEHWGHFSQIVWNQSTTVGCYTQDCSAGGLLNVGGNVAPYFTVCNYYPAGNMGGEYGANIFPGTSDVTASWDQGLE